MNYIDLCCGIGSFHYSFKKHGLNCVLACDIDKFARNTYYANYDIAPKEDLYTLDIESIPQFDILCAGFPCQPFSNAGFHKGFEDTRGTIFFKIMEIIEMHKPRIIVFENVPALISHNSGNTFKTILSSIRDSGYFVDYKLINSNDYGIPQMRKRVIIIGSLDNNVSQLLNFDKFKNKETLSEYMGRKFKRDVAYTIRCGGRGSKLGDKHNWDSYIVDDTVYRLTIDDALKLQGFDKNFKLSGSATQQWKQLGNTIPTNITNMIASNIVQLNLRY